MQTRRSTAIGPIREYMDRSTGARVVVARPADNPQLWAAYLQGAVVSYRKHGVESVLEYDSVIDGQSTSLFFAALDANGRVVGGMRAQGPYRTPDQAHAMSEWNDREGTAELREEIADMIPYGVVEMKTGWVSDDFSYRRELADTMSRVFVHTMRLLDVRFAIGTVAEHAVRRWSRSGGVVNTRVHPVAYPDERYSTVLMTWDNENFAGLMAGDQLTLMLDEAAQLTSDQSLPMPVKSLAMGMVAA